MIHGLATGLLCCANLSANRRMLPATVSHWLPWTRCSHLISNAALVASNSQHAWASTELRLKARKSLHLVLIWARFCRCAPSSCQCYIIPLIWARQARLEHEDGSECGNVADGSPLTTIRAQQRMVDMWIAQDRIAHYFGQGDRAFPIHFVSSTSRPG